jgi:5-oxoprolinase (ATP-hydrolysing) subunit C
MSDSAPDIAIFRKAGFMTIVQGIPFRGHRHLGMPLAGAADPISLALANWLVGNDAETSAYETTMMPAELVALADCCVAVQGAAARLFIDEVEQDTNSTIILRQGQTLHIPSPVGGCRSYIAFRGGVAGERPMGASSTYLPAAYGGSRQPVPDGYAIQACSRDDTPYQQRTLPPEYRLPPSNDHILRITDASESGLQNDPAKLTEEPFRISRRADRIGLELEGQNIALKPHPQMQSSAVFPGTIQCPPSGNPFLLGPDAQTTGGYPRIAQVIRADRHLIGQLRPGSRVKLQRIKPAEAERLYRSKLELLRKLQPDIRLD